MSAPNSHTNAEPPYLTPLHSAIEQQIGELGRSGAVAWTAVLPLLNRCSQIIKGFEERIATGELTVVSETALKAEAPEKRAGAPTLDRSRKGPSANVADTAPVASAPCVVVPRKLIERLVEVEPRNDGNYQTAWKTLNAITRLLAVATAPKSNAHG